MKYDPPVFHRYRLARIFKVHVRVIDRWIATGKLASTTDELGRPCCTYEQVRHFIMLYGLETDEERVDQLRKHIFATYAAHPHAFERGCGRDTMVRWICEVTEVQHSPRAVRRALDEMAVEGLFVKGTNFSGHTTYHLRNPDA